MDATPIWFGPENRPLLGWFHSPQEGRAGRRHHLSTHRDATTSKRTTRLPHARRASGRGSACGACGSITTGR